jgi:hypothetical protein
MPIRQNVRRTALLRRLLLAEHLKLKGLDAKSRWLAGLMAAAASRRNRIRTII